MQILTDIWSITAILAAALITGAGITFWLCRYGFTWYKPREKTEKQNLYLVFSHLAHRLKTATEVMRGHLHGFNDDLPKDAERWKVARQAISEETDGIDGFIETLDLLVRLGIERHALIIEPVNVVRMLEDLMVKLGPVADARGIFLGGVVTASAQDKMYVSADASALKEIFSNILENSLKHNDKGTEIKAEVHQKDQHLVVSISDNGKGIPPEVISRLFDKVSLNYSPKKTHGSGMGLYLCKLLVELHHGKIMASSPAGKGLEIAVWLPLRRIPLKTID